MGIHTRVWYGWVDTGEYSRVGGHTGVQYVWTDTQDTIQVDRDTGRLRGRTLEMQTCSLVADWITFMRRFFRVSSDQSFWFP